MTHTGTDTLNTTHPRALLTISTCYSLFMWAFSTIVATLTLYFTTLPGITTEQAYTLYAIYASLLWILPVIGGFVSEKIGYLQAAFAGLTICIIAFVLLCYHNLPCTFTGLSLFLIGNCLFTPSLWCIVDHLYQKQDIRREAGFTLFYLIFNIGAVLGIFISSYIRIRYNYPLEFASCGIILAIALLLLAYSCTTLTVAKNRSISAQINVNNKTIPLFTLLACIIFTPLIYSLFQYPTVDTVLVYIISITALLYLIRLGRQQTTTAARHKVFGFIILCLFALGFWTLYNLEPSLLSVFIEHGVNKTLFGFKLNADAFFGFEALFIVIIGLFLTNFWLYLAKHNKDLSLAIKFGLALIFMGVGFLYLDFVSRGNGVCGQVPALLIILSYTFFATGELFIGPLGISMVGQLSPEGKEGTLMGVWQLVVGIGAIASGALAKLSVVSQHASIRSQQQAYCHLFKDLGIVIVIGGILVLLASPWVKPLLGDK